MATPRLRLDWSLNTAAERTEFVNKYIESVDFQFNEEELEMLGSYVLWAKPSSAEEERLNEEFPVEIKSAHNTWSKNADQSIEQILETPSTERNFIDLSVPLRKKKERFDRAKARQEAPPHILEVLEDLWRQIDYIDLQIRYYDLRHGRTTKEPPEHLVDRFDEPTIAKIKEKSESMPQYQYLHLRHLIVELRREQYTLRDFYKPIIQRETPPLMEEPTSIEFGAEVDVLPLGLCDDRKIAGLIFRDEQKLLPRNYSQQELRLISDYLWRESEDAPLIYDFRELEHVYQTLLSINQFDDDDPIIVTLRYYIKLANLSEIHNKILELKLHRYLNQTIADVINGEFGKTYTANYISTIFRQKIIPRINAAAQYHYDIVSNLFFEENFHTCNKCGRTLLLSPYNFIRKSQSSTGYMGTCKQCDKENRKRKKLTMLD